MREEPLHIVSSWRSCASPLLERSFRLDTRGALGGPSRFLGMNSSIFYSDIEYRVCSRALWHGRHGHEMPISIVFID